MCASYWLQPDASRNAGQTATLMRDLVFGDCVLTIERIENGFNNGRIWRAHEPRNTLWSLLEVTIDEVFTQAKDFLGAETKKSIARTLEDLVPVSTHVGMSAEEMLACMRTTLSQIEARARMSLAGKEGT